MVSGCAMAATSDSREVRLGRGGGRQDKESKGEKSQDREREDHVG
jgi:hypothetical protein